MTPLVLCRNIYLKSDRYDICSTFDQIGFMRHDPVSGRHHDLVRAASWMAQHQCSGAGWSDSLWVAVQDNTFADADGSLFSEPPDLTLSLANAGFAVSFLEWLATARSSFCTPQPA